MPLLNATCRSSNLSYLVLVIDLRSLLFHSLMVLLFLFALSPAMSLNHVELEIHGNQLEEGLQEVCQHPPKWSPALGHFPAEWSGGPLTSAARYPRQTPLKTSRGWVVSLRSAHRKP